jgi:RNA polymerase sigma-70 factor (ECF subfamily)
MHTTHSVDSPRSTAPTICHEDRRLDAVEEHLRTLMDQYERPLYHFLVALVGPDEAADHAQETFLRAYAHLCAGKSITRGWLYTVARHLALDHVQYRKRMHPRPELLDQLPARQPSDHVALVRRCLDRLALHERELLYLFDVDGFTTPEIGALLGISGTAVRQRLCRARVRFRARWCELAREE